MRWSAGAVIAGWFFILSENRNIAADGAILLHDMEERAVSVLLTKEQFDRECGYRTALSIMGNLYAQGLLTDKEYSKPITIGKGTWIASNVTIIGGVTIGEGCVIGAGSVVTRSIPPFSLAAGNPCRVVRKITEEDSIYLKKELF